MSRIHSRGNKATELALATLLRRHGITGWRRQRKLIVEKLMVDRRKGGNTSSGLRPPSPKGGDDAARARRTVHQPSTLNPQFTVRPDFVFRQVRLALFVDGCFWHGCPKHATQPKNNRVFWQRKFSANKKRDALVTRTLRRAGWRVLRVWEHTLRWATRKPQNEARLVRRIRRALGSD